MKPIIYRSREFSQKTKWHYRLKAVEIVIGDDFHRSYIYDVGFDPPFYDVSKGVEFYHNVSMPYTRCKIESVIESKGIFVESWDIVGHLLSHESNALIRADLRQDVKSIYNFKDDEIEFVPYKVGMPAIKSMFPLDGYIAQVEVKFMVSNSNFLLSYKDYFIVKLMNRDERGQLRFIAKGNDDCVSLLIECKEELTCDLFDTEQMNFIYRGKLIELKIHFYITGNEIQYHKLNHHIYL